MADRFARASYLRAADAESLIPFAVEDSALVRELPQLLKSGTARAQVLGTIGGELLVTVYRVGIQTETVRFRAEGER